MPPDGGETFIVNLHAPTGKRTTMNESSSGALGIPELRSPAAMNFHSKNRRKDYELSALCSGTDQQRGTFL